jgi:hypothetical protein
MAAPVGVRLVISTSATSLRVARSARRDVASRRSQSLAVLRARTSYEHRARALGHRHGEGEDRSTATRPAGPHREDAPAVGELARQRGDEQRADRDGEDGGQADEGG